MQQIKRYETMRGDEYSKRQRCEQKKRRKPQEEKGWTRRARKPRRCKVWSGQEGGDEVEATPWTTASKWYWGRKCSTEPHTRSLSNSLASRVPSKVPKSQFSVGNLNHP
ncbi:Uncharacterized protein HZ326_14928 [Fusarium oxysporum f. sp. albedinis]|nr:Uncharacterized protein HZ326_14928 [Fusarium oxysporum f. sp. albedinis]